MSMPTVIKCMGVAGPYPCDHVGQYLKSTDFEAHNGRGYITFTPELAQAMKFENKNAALVFYLRASKTVPVRSDGRPNRPLTAYHIEIEELPLAVGVK
jgi:hypothetical protein